MIVRRRAVAIGAEQIELLFAKAGDVGKRLSPRQHREQAEQQDFLERTGEFAGLPMIRHIFEIRKKKLSSRRPRLAKSPCTN